MNQKILLQKRLQDIPQELLVFPKRPWFVKIGGHLLTHTFQKASLETPETSQDFNGVIRMVADGMGLVG